MGVGVAVTGREGCSDLSRNISRSMFATSDSLGDGNGIRGGDEVTLVEWFRRGKSCHQAGQSKRGLHLDHELASMCEGFKDRGECREFKCACGREGDQQLIENTTLCGKVVV